MVGQRLTSNSEHLLSKFLFPDVSACLLILLISQHIVIPSLHSYFTCNQGLELYNQSFEQSLRDNLTQQTVADKVTKHSLRGFSKNFFHLKGKERETVNDRKKEKEIVYLLVHSPNARSSQGLAKPKPGVQNSIQDSHVDGRDPGTSAISCCLPKGTLAACWFGSQGIRNQT